MVQRESERKALFVIPRCWKLNVVSGDQSPDPWDFSHWPNSKEVHTGSMNVRRSTLDANGVGVRITNSTQDSRFLNPRSRLLLAVCEH